MDSEATRPSVSKTKLFSSPTRSIANPSPLSDNSSVALPDAGSTEADNIQARRQGGLTGLT